MTNKEAINLLDNLIGMVEDNRNSDYDKTLKMAIEALKQQERKPGKWIETSEGTMCGNCHKFPYDDGEYHIANWYSDFCPNCGADMRQRREDAEIH